MLLLLIAAASAQSLVTFQVSDGGETSISLSSEVLEDGSSLAEPLVCGLPCTVELKPGIYDLTASRGRNVQYSAAIELFEGESWVTIPVARGFRLVPNLSGVVCFPPYIPLVRDFKDEDPLVEGEAEAL